MEVNFIMIDAYSLCTTIMARPWLYTMGVVSSTLHLKVKYLLRDQVDELIGSQSVAKQCLVAGIRHQTRGESLAFTKRDL